LIYFSFSWAIIEGQNKTGPGRTSIFQPLIRFIAVAVDLGTGRLQSRGVAGFEGPKLSAVDVTDLRDRRSTGWRCDRTRLPQQFPVVDRFSLIREHPKLWSNAQLKTRNLNLPIKLLSGRSLTACTSKLDENFFREGYFL